MQQVNIFWFRRDLRLEDNAGLFHALTGNYPVLPVFIFDRHILDKLSNKNDRRLCFIHNALEKMQRELIKTGSSLEVFYGEPLHAFENLFANYTINTVFINHDYEPYAGERDAGIAGFVRSKGASFRSFKDQVIFEKEEIVKDDGKPYTVFTPYSRKWKASLQEQHLASLPSENYMGNFYRQAVRPIPALLSMGFSDDNYLFPGRETETQLIAGYKEQRNFPAKAGTSKLGVHLRFGTISLRQLAHQCQPLSETFLNELIWRDFYQMILWHFPRVGKGQAFKPAYEHIEWRRDEGEFEKWCQGKTGYPIVDAGMRELNATGFMHNRIRMIVASFLCKHLLLDWRLGEAYFAEKLLDFDLAANNGGWQWAAGSGCDAAPYFRIFNPYLQTKRFDPDLAYINKWVPELNDMHYPKPIVEHEFARNRCLAVFKHGLKKNDF
ncbi:MAG: deoxyribodipyrimidine photo-lyase [Chitinophagaceae bacterium]|nr:deoxyribodipyrimidine photo-lyase [Chitinophagaceae bacterium]